jgi:predicted esterase
MKSGPKTISIRFLGFVAIAMAAFANLLSAAPPDVARDENQLFHLTTTESDYWGYYPDTYTGATPISLFVWMHGCGGDSRGDMFGIAPYGYGPVPRENQSYIAISIGGRDGGCWKVNTDGAKVLAAIKDVSRRFNIDPRKIYLGGYSSGGDLTYRVGFEHADLFAGLLVENSSPFRDSGLSQSTVATAPWKIHVAHLLHTEDTVYPAAGVRNELATLASKGFPVVKIEKAGHHYDESDYDSGFGTDSDLRKFLLPYLDAGWNSPEPAIIPSVTTLSKLVVQGAKISPKFSPKTTQYTSKVTAKVKSIKLTPTVGSKLVTIKVNGKVVKSNATKVIKLKTGKNTVSIVLTAGNSPTKKYQIIITKEK